MSDVYDNIDQIVEAALFAAGEPLSVDRLQGLFTWAGRPTKEDIIAALERIEQACELRGVELTRVASGYRFQAKSEYAIYLQKLWEKKPPKYSRALLETLALVVYRQPITRGEIEDVRGVAVSTNIMKTLQDRDWIKVVGSRDVPGKPALFGTTKQFLDDFNLKTLSELPPLQDIMNIEELEEKLGMQFDLPPSEETQQEETETEDEQTSNEVSEAETPDAHASNEPAKAEATDDNASDEEAAEPENEMPEAEPATA